MRTDQLVIALAQDRVIAPAPVDRTLSRALLLSVPVTLAAFWMVLGPRADFVESVANWRFLFKFVVTLALALSSLVVTLRLASPLARPLRATAPLLAVVLLLSAGVAVELLSTPSSLWLARVAGRNAVPCLIAIPLLAVPPLIGSLLALRGGAPASPALAGAIAGGLAGGLAASVYAAHCIDDSPLFLAAWYSVGVLVVVAVGAIAGRQMLRW